MKRRVRAVLFGAAAVGVLSLASIVNVPRGTATVLTWRGGGTPALLRPGLSFRIPILQRVDRYPDGVLTLEGTVSVESRQGSKITLPVTVILRPDEQHLLTLHRAGGGPGARTAVLELVGERLKRTAAGFGTHDLAVGAAAQALESQVRAALEEHYDNAEVSIGEARLSPELQAAFDKGAIYARRKETGLEIILVGIDGADWDVIDPMIARGELPNLARIKREGVWARLRSSVPTLSPLLWTTVATGKSPDRHGINDFLVTDARTGHQVPIDSSFRRTKAIWNILSEAGLSCDIIAWWATWPAEAISGHLVSDRVAYSTFNFKSPKAGAGAVYPEGYAPVVEKLRVPDSAIDHRFLSRFLHIGEDELREARAAAARKAPMNESLQSIMVMTRVLAATETYRKVVLDLLETRHRDASPARLLAVYFQGVDEVNHRFAHCAPPRTSLCSDADFRRFRDAVTAFYAYQDGIVGEIAQRAAKATIVVMSDHGFASGGDRPEDVKPFIEGKPGLWHDLVGVFLAAGPGLGHGEIPTVSLYDIAPTLLHLLGLPVPDDMSGKVLEAALSTGFATSHPISRAPSYEGLEGGRPASRQAPPGAGGPGQREAAPGEAAEEEIVERLKSLGYVGGEGGPDPAPGTPGERAPQSTPAAAGAVPTVLFHTNLGTVYLGKRRFELAQAEYRKALAIDPSSVQALSGLAVLYESKGQPEQALEMLRALVRLDEVDPRVTLEKMAELFIRMGRAADGLTYMKDLGVARGSKGRHEIGLSVALGRLYLAVGKEADAESTLNRALGIDPASVGAMQELFALYDAQNRAATLEPRIRAALSREPRSAMHHNWLGLVLKRKGDLKNAEAEFKNCLEIAPDLAGPMANLGALYLQQGRSIEAVAILERAIEKDPRSVESRTNLIVALGMEHDLEGARLQVESAETAGQRVPLYYNALAYALHRNGRDEEALATLRESLSLDPGQGDALRLRSELEQGRPVAEPPGR
jgi:predicted AlkP superfamily phosphohydrolase/phosphomutase/Tfp pilus assembly protein PilF